MKKIVLKTGVVVSGLFPYLVSAQNYIGSQTNGVAWGSIKDIVEAIGKFVSSTVMPIIVSLGFLYFIWNMGQYILKLDNEKERESFKKYSINALLALFIMMSLWGIIAIGTQTLFGTQPIVPQFRTNANGNGTGVPQ